MVELRRQAASRPAPSGEQAPEVPLAAANAVAEALRARAAERFALAALEACQGRYNELARRVLAGEQTPAADYPDLSKLPPANHAEALELACIRAGKSNLARAYIELHAYGAAPHTPGPVAAVMDTRRRGQIRAVCIVAAWLNGDLSEGQASKALGVDRLGAREWRDSVIAAGVSFQAASPDPVIGAPARAAAPQPATIPPTASVTEATYTGPTSNAAPHTPVEPRSLPLTEALAREVCKIAGRDPDENIGDGHGVVWPLYEEVLHRLAAYATPQAAAGAWRPIESAPRGGEQILVLEFGVAVHAKWSDFHSAWVTMKGVSFCDHPTHWMPLPPPPVEPPQEPTTSTERSD